MTPYAGDRQLEPDKEHECPHCFQVFGSSGKLLQHVWKCPKNDDFDPPDNDFGEPL